MTALVLSGGGTKGAVEVGVALYLDRALGIHASTLIGVSVGAINAVKIAEGQEPYLVDQPAPPEDTARGVLGLARIWRSLSSRADMIEFTSDVHRVLGGYTSSLHPTEDGPLELLANAGSLLPKIKRILQTDSLGSLEPMRKLLDDDARLSWRLLARQGVDVRVGFVAERAGAMLFGQLRRGKADVLDERGQLLAPGACSFPDAVLAAAAIPIAFSPLQLLDDFMVDGGVRMVTPIAHAVAIGAQRIIAVTAPGWALPYDHMGASPFATPEPFEADVALSPGHSRLLKHGIRSIGDLLYDQLTVHETTPRPDWPPVVTSIVPELDVIGTAEIDPGKIDLAMSYGYALVTAQLDPRIRSNSARKYIRDLETDIAMLRALAITQQRQVHTTVGETVGASAQANANLEVQSELEENWLEKACGAAFSKHRAALERTSAVAGMALSIRPDLGFVSEPYGGDPVPMSDAGWARSPRDKPEPNEYDDDMVNDLAREWMNEARDRLQRDRAIAASKELRGIPDAVGRRISTWRSGSGPIKQTWWGSLAVEFGRTPGTLLGAFDFDTYPLPSTGTYTQYHRTAPAIRFGQRLDLLVIDGQRVLHLSRPAFAPLGDPFHAADVWTVPEGQVPTAVSLTQQHVHGEVPGGLLAAITVGPVGASPAGVHLFVSDGPGSTWSPLPGFTPGATGDAALLTVDDGHSLCHDLFTPFGPGVVHYRAYSGIGSPRTDFTQFSSVNLPDDLVATHQVVAVAACQTNRAPAGRPRDGSIELVVTALDTTTGTSTLLSMQAPASTGQWSTGTPFTDTSGHPIRCAGAPAFMQNSTGGFELVTSDEGVYHYRREWNGQAWRPVQQVVQIEQPRAAEATCLGLVELDDGQPRDLVLSYDERPWALESSRPLLATVAADETWQTSPVLISYATGLR